MLELAARLAEGEKVDPAAQYRTTMVRAQRAFGEARYDEAETLARLARNLNVDNAAADALVKSVEARRLGTQPGNQDHRARFTTTCTGRWGRGLF